MDAPPIDLGVIRSLGEALVEDDMHDFGKFSYPGHPSPLHHWQYGLIMIVGADIAELAMELSSLMGLLSGDTPLPEPEETETINIPESDVQVVN